MRQMTKMNALDHVKPIGQKILLKVLRREDNGLILADKDVKEFEAFFPVVAIGERITNFQVGDYVALIPERKFGIIPDMTGETEDEFMLVTEYDIDYKVTKEYAEKAKTWKRKESVLRQIKDFTMPSAQSNKETGVGIIDKTKYK